MTDTETKPKPTGLINNRPQLTDTSEMMRMANALSGSAMCPAQFKGKPQDAFAAILAGAEVGFQPMQSLKSIAVINGRPTIYGDGLPAIAYGSGQLEFFEEVVEGKGDSETAIVRIERKDVRGVREFRFSIADAKRASLWGKRGPWSDYPTRMLQMRARSYAFRDVFADYLAGLHVAEEMRDIVSGATAEIEQEGPRISFDTPEPADEVPYPAEDVIDADAEPVRLNIHGWTVLIKECETEADLEQLVAAEIQNECTEDEIALLEPHIEAKRKEFIDA